MEFNTLIQVTEYFAVEENCNKHIYWMRWGNGEPVCTFCGHEKCYTLNGKTKRFKCAGCRKQFSLTKGTIFECSQISKQTWFVGIWLITQHKKGISSVQLASDLGITQKSAWFMGHRIRHFMMSKNAPKMSGIVQVDETYVGGKNRNLHWEKKKLYPGGRGMGNKTAVVGVMGMKGNVRLEVVKDTSGATLLPIVGKNTTEASVIVTDNWKGYRNLNHTRHHVAISHEKWEFARGVFNTNRLEGFWALLKRGIIGIYHWVSPKHLQRYCDEFSYRYNALALDNRSRFVGMAGGIHNRLSYATLIEGKKYGRKPKV